MSAIARVLLEQGALVSGSDLVISPVAAALERDGVRVFTGHSRRHVNGAEIVAVSSAIPQSNAEVLAAHEAGLRVMKRPELLGALMQDKIGLAVAGTHGKTTTTAMIASILLAAGCDPTIIVGGVARGLGTNARFGRGPHFLVEADEYDHTFLSLSPTVAVVTNVEHDHPDCYPTLASVRAAFEAFTDLLPPDGLLAVCVDDPLASALGARRRAAGGSTVTFGLGPDADWRAEEVRPNFAGGVDFLALRRGQVKGLVRLRLPGAHNASNATAALAVAEHLGIEFQTAREALTAFLGVARRFELKGDEGGVVAVDDYAHHPTEIRAVLRAARERFPAGRVWAVWQPHTYSRTRALYAAFVGAFADADRVIVLPVYAAREPVQGSLSTSQLAADIGKPAAVAVDSFEQAVGILLEEVRAGDVVMTLGAGDGHLVGERLLERLRAEGLPRLAA
jgi:UDP-N-acetylmuramate--alanine ligase